MVKCIVNYNYGGYGSFPKRAYDYLVNKYSNELADSVLETDSDLSGWDHMLQKRENVYFPVEDKDNSRLNKYLIEAVENVQTGYSIATGEMVVEDYDGMDKSVIMVFR